MKIDTSIRLMPDDTIVLVNVTYGKTMKGYVINIDQAMMAFPNKTMLEAVCKAARRRFKQEM